MLLESQEFAPHVVVVDFTTTCGFTLADLLNTPPGNTTHGQKNSTHTTNTHTHSTTTKTHSTTTKTHSTTTKTHSTPTKTHTTTTSTHTTNNAVVVLSATGFVEPLISHYTGGPNSLTTVPQFAMAVRHPLTLLQQLNNVLAYYAIRYVADWQIRAPTDALRWVCCAMHCAMRCAV